jgi:glucokinase
MYALGIDIGGTNCRIARVDEQGRILVAHRFPLKKRDVDSLVSAIAQAYADLPPQAEKPHRAGVGIAGWVRVRDQRVMNAPNLGWRDVDLAGPLAHKLGMPVTLVNDLDAIVYGEARAGAAKGEREVVALFVGTGVGLGVMVRGFPVEGADGYATEIGHLKVAGLDGRPCNCGQRGCLEAYTSGAHLGKRVAELAREGLATTLPTDGSARSDAIEAAERSGDALAKRLSSEMVELLGDALATVCTLFNPRVVVLGGGVMAGAPTIAQRVIERAQARTLHESAAGVRMLRTQLGDDAGIIGAALLSLVPPEQWRV